MITATVLKLNEPNLNGNMYSPECISKAISECKKDVDDCRFCLERNNSLDADVNLGNVCGIVKDIWIEDNDVVADIQFLTIGDSPFLESLFEAGKLSVRTKGVGVVEGNEIKNYRLISLFLTDNPA